MPAYLADCLLAHMAGLPAHMLVCLYSDALQVMVATVRCEQIAADKMQEFENHEVSAQ